MTENTENNEGIENTENIESTANSESAVNPETPEKQSRARSAYEWMETFVAAAFITLLIFTFVGRIVSVEGDSMNPTLLDSQRLIISDLGYTPKTGDIVVLQKATSDEYRLTRPLVKRVIATGGQTIKFDFTNWKVYVDGRELEENYILRYMGQRMNSYSLQSDTLTVPEGYIFVMGDNRNNSADSRYYAVGLIAENEILGHVIFRLFPLTTMGVPK